MPIHPQATLRAQQMLPRNHRAAKWQGVPDAQWYDWKRQLKNRINSVEELEEVLTLTESERIGASAKGIFRLDITPYFASLYGPRRPHLSGAAASHPDASRTGKLYLDDGRLAGRGQAQPGAGAGPPLPRQGADAGHHPMRELQKRVWVESPRF